MVDPLLQWVVALGLALVFGSAAWHKRSAPAHFRAQVAAYRVLPPVLLRPAAGALPWIELATALGLLIVPLRPAAGVAAATLLLTYGAAMLINLLRGRTDIDCGCGGQAQPLSRTLVVRNLILAAGAGTLILPATPRQMSLGDLLLLPGLLALLTLTYACVAQISGNAGALRGWSAHES
jgi:hypothetical protein